MKSIALLATALFLASAPSPDPETISQLSAGFLSSVDSQPILAAESGQVSANSSTLVSETSTEELSDEGIKQETVN